MLSDYKIENNSSVVYPLVGAFGLLIVSLLLFNLPEYNLYVKLVLDTIIVILFFTYLIKFLNKNNKDRYLILLNSEGFYYHEKLMFHWGHLNKVQAVSKMKITKGIISQDHFVVIKLKNGKSYEIKIDFVDGNLDEIKKNVEKFESYYGGIAGFSV